MNKSVMFFIMALCLVASALAESHTVVVDSNTSMQFYNESLGDWQSAVQADKTNSLWDLITIPAQWIWRTLRVNPTEAVDGSTVLFKKDFVLPKCIENIQGTIDITTDNAYKFSVNTLPIGEDSGYLPGGSDMGWSQPEQYELGNLRTGLNEFYFEAKNIPQAGGNEFSNPAGIIYSATITYDDSETCGGDVPEFGVVAASIAMISALGGIVLFRRH